MLKKWPQGISPRFCCHPDNFKSIADALKNVGHVVVEDLFSTTSLTYCKKYLKHLFETKDADYQNGKMNEAERKIYFESTYSFIDQAAQSYCEAYLSMLQRSHLLDVFHYLLKGDVAAAYGPVLRRVDPKYSLRHVGLHKDGLLTEYTQHAYQSNDEYTLWTPLSDIDVETSTVLFLSNKYQFPNNTAPGEAADTVILYNTLTQQPLDITPLFLHNLPKKNFSKEEEQEANHRYYNALNHLITEAGDNLYAPTLKLGSAIIFDQHVVHGSFFHTGLKKTRYSIDIRLIGDFDKLIDYDLKIPSYIFEKYTRHTFHPSEIKPKQPSLQDFTASLESKINSLYQLISQQQAEIDLLQKRSTFKERLKKIKLLKQVKQKISHHWFRREGNQI